MVAAIRQLIAYRKRLLRILSNGRVHKHNLDYTNTETKSSHIHMNDSEHAN